MAASSYTPGTWFGVVRSGTVVLLTPATPPSLVRSLWELLGGEPEVHEVLHAVTSASSGSLAQIPWFGIVDFRESLRVFLRGDIELTAHLAAGPVELNGSDVTTWTERRLSEPEWYTVSVPAGAPGGPGTAELPPGAGLPLGEGVVLLQSLTVGRATGVLEPMPAVLREAAGQEPVQEPVREPDAVPVTEQAPEPATEPATKPVREVRTEFGVSAETVMEVHDDELEYTADGTAGFPEDDAAEEPDAVPAPDAPGPEQELVPANELTSSYDHLWDKTVMRRIEDAAVRDEPEEEQQAAPREAPEVNDAGEGNQPAAAEPDQPPAAAPSGVPATPFVPAQAGPSSKGGLIDSVPWNTGGDKPARPSGPPSFVPASFVPPAPGPPAPVPPAPGDVSGQRSQSSAPPVLEGDHDGETIMKSDLAGLSAGRQVQTPAGDRDPATGPMVLARVCPQGHANPPTHSQCAGCGLSLASDAVQVRRPRLGRVRVSTGELIDLDQSLVIGRQPSVSRVQGGGMPRLVQVASPSGDISRSHVEVRLEGWHVMLCDLKATNGTVLVREGQPPRRLAQNEMAILLDGDIAELGDDVSLRFEEIL
ncbi:FHA domain-containing protein [Arthrobacter sp. ISL-72]|uniref:FHA domain-containing protein n=1 Tax=Arthrobacter sp. ISL-72 TaxID=2819114 RepID=UPI001BE90003|nr:FHA domain-containing protein [Arthrobacter sp. ISL-72]MBT2595429.1 FHA domain-containing protein [Arthrobacter sp. ISL-72]